VKLPIKNIDGLIYYQIMRWISSCLHVILEMTLIFFLTIGIIAFLTIAYIALIVKAAGISETAVNFY
jgi:hypothetical protein